MPISPLPRLIQTAGLVFSGLLLASPIFAQQGQHQPRNCIEEITQSCRTDRLQMHLSLSDRTSELSGSFAEGLGDQAQQRGRRGQQTGRGQRGGQAGRGQRGQRGERSGRGRRGDGTGTRQRRGEQGAQPFIAAVPVSQTVVYGQHPRQQVDVYEPDNAVETLPLVVFVHGGGWSAGDHKAVHAKPGHFNAAGYYFASTGYRVIPDGAVEDQAADLGTALQALRAQAAAGGFDPDKIALIGHSSGAHLAALVASDPSYAGDAFEAIKGVILLDSAAYDVPAHIASAGPQSWQLFSNVFGYEAERQQALSPITHIGDEDAPHWLAIHIEQREESRSQSEALVAHLAEAGSEAEVLSVSDSTHGRLNREIGMEAGSQQTQAIDAFLARVFG